MIMCCDASSIAAIRHSACCRHGQARRAWRFGLGYALIMVVSGLTAAGEEKSDAAAGERLPVILVPIQQATLSAEVTSTVTEIQREMGQNFAAKDILIQLDKTVHTANRDKAKAQEASARAQLQSKESLLADGQASATEVETARMNLAVAATELIIAEKHLAACSVRAPWSGRVVRVHVNRHELVQPGQPLVEIVDDHILRAQFLVPSTALPRLKLGQDLRIAVAETGGEVKAVISHIGAVIDPASSTVKVLAEIPNHDGALRAGMRGTALLPAAPAVKDAANSER